MPCRGVRGATTVEADGAEEIVTATRELLERMVVANGMDAADVASVILTVTPDLTAAFPARAAREMGWGQVALLDATEIPVPGSLPRCVRVLIHWNTDRTQAEVRHVYLRGAVVLRPEVTWRYTEEHRDTRRGRGDRGEAETEGTGGDVEE